MATEFRQATLEGAGMALRELVKKGNALEAQISIAFIIAYLCFIYELKAEVVVHTLLHNANEVLADDALLRRVTETMHNMATKDHVALSKTDESPLIETSHKVGDLKRHGITPVTH